MNTIEFVREVLETLRDMERDMEDVVDVIYRLDAEAVVERMEMGDGRMTREEIEMEIIRLEDEIADLNRQIEEYEEMLDECEVEE